MCVCIYKRHSNNKKTKFLEELLTLGQVQLHRIAHMAGLRLTWPQFGSVGGGD